MKKKTCPFLQVLLCMILACMPAIPTEGLTDTGKLIYVVSAAASAVESTETAEESTISTEIKDVSGGKFVRKEDKWRYRLKNGKYAQNGFYRISGKVYCFDEKGYRLSGWQTINGEKYYFGKSAEGWMYCSKWVSYKNKLYYLNKKGTTPYGWRTLSGKRYYFTRSGYAVTGKKSIGGTDYYFNAQGVLQHSGVNLTVSADCAILIEASTGEVIYAKNPDMHHANASTTKILTCILALERCKLSDKVTASAYAASQEPTKLYMNAGESFRLKDLLYSLMLPSHNDTAVAIAEHISGTANKFVSLMNKKAKKIGCTNTHFATPNGLDSGLNHYTTARDIAKIAQYAYKNATFRKIINTSTYSFRSLSGRQYYLTTTNRFLGNMSGVCGMKTGFTNKAQHCFCGVIKAKNGKTYISVVLGAPSSEKRWDDSSKLLQYAYNLK